ncbi:MAG: hypothetical protein WCE42_07325 [Rhizobium ruizarguesonis]
MEFVDVNLEDGPTGSIVGRTLADANVSVLFMTSDPGAIRGGVPGALGVIQKPVLDLELVEVIQYVADRRAGNTDIPPPKCLIEFPPLDGKRCVGPTLSANLSSMRIMRTL